MRVVIAPDKFKGTATAPELAAALAEAVEAAGHHVIAIPMADGGDGTLDAFGGANRATTVTGPLGEPIEAAWRLANGEAIVEMAAASGLVAAGGADANDPLDATTRGTGELIMTAMSRGAKRIIVGLGGSATTDGGLGAVEAIGSPARLAGVRVEVATDVTTRFVDAARVFGPQKGASAAQVAFLEARLRGIAQKYRDEFGVDVENAPGSGAAGGLGGGLLALGAEIVPGFDLIAEERGLVDAIAEADLVITGEGQLDRESFAGKVVGGVADLADEFGVRLVIVAGAIDPEHGGLPSGAQAVSLSDRFGLDAAMADPCRLAAHVVGELLGE
ncbi:MAG: glycerate kinase [Actinomycetota bacterium]